jgi:hypothetical protein
LRAFGTISQGQKSRGVGPTGLKDFLGKALIGDHSEWPILALSLPQHALVCVGGMGE